MRYLITLLALAGVTVSVLALRVHFSTDTAPCSINERWDCGIVNHSLYSEVDGIPVAAIGIVGYLLLAGLALVKQRFFLLLGVFAGFCFALRLTFVEQFALHMWCVYCVISQSIIALLLLLSAGWLGADYYALKSPSRPS